MFLHRKKNISRLEITTLFRYFYMFFNHTYNIPTHFIANLLIKIKYIAGS